MIPGAMFINVLAGSLYGLWGSFCTVACVSTLGAGLNYWLARLLVRVSPDLMHTIEVDRYKHQQAISPQL